MVYILPPELQFAVVQAVMKVLVWVAWAVAIDVLLNCLLVCSTHGPDQRVFTPAA